MMTYQDAPQLKFVGEIEFKMRDLDEGLGVVRRANCQLVYSQPKCGRLQVQGFNGRPATRQQFHLRDDFPQYQKLKPLRIEQPVD